MTYNCFVCGINRERLDKNSEGKKDFLTHITVRNCYFNYHPYKKIFVFKINNNITL